MNVTRMWIVCPSWKDVPSFTMLQARTREIIEARPSDQRLEVRFVLVDDTAGTDESIAKLEADGDVRVITPPFNLGHQRAIVYGLRTALPDIDDPDLIVTMDADGEDRPEDIPRLIEPILAKPPDHRMLSIAQRTERKESLRFKVLYLFFRLMFRTLTGTTVRSGNFAGYRAFLAKRMLRHPYFDLCYSSTLINIGIDITPVPCARGTRYEGQSRMNMLRLVMHGVRMLMPFTDRVAVRALMAFSSVFGLGILAALAVAGIRTFTNAAIPGWTTFTLLGMLILSFVALGNFIVLFAVFSHSRGVSLANLEVSNGRSPGGTPPTSD
ncbi:MAG: glycosyltransferase family 2 protein [Acidimicrobiales bacterium]